MEEARTNPSNDPVGTTAVIWRVTTTIGSVLLAVAVLAVLQLKYSQPQELH